MYLARGSYRWEEGKKNGFCRERWRLWRELFGSVADTEEVWAETRELAGLAAEKMRGIEENEITNAQNEQSATGGEIINIVNKANTEMLALLYSNIPRTQRGRVRTICGQKNYLASWVSKGGDEST